MKYLTPFLSFVLIPLLVTAPLIAQIVEHPGAPGNSVESEDLQIRVITGDAGSASVNSQAANGFTVEVMGSDGAPVVDAAVAVRLPDMEPTGAFSDGSHAVVGYTDQSGRARLAAVKWGGVPGMVAIRVTAVKGTAHAGILVEEKLSAASASPATAQARAAVPAPIVTESPSTATEAGMPSMPLPQAPIFAKPAALESSVGTAAVTHPLTPAATPMKTAPSVSITSSAPPGTQSHSHKKWIVIAAIAAGAGAGLAFAGRGKSSSSSPQAPSLTIGAPTVSVGHP